MKNIILIVLTIFSVANVRAQATEKRIDRVVAILINALDKKGVVSLQKAAIEIGLAPEDYKAEQFKKFTDAIKQYIIDFTNNPISNNSFGHREAKVLDYLSSVNSIVFTKLFANVGDQISDVDLVVYILHEATHSLGMGTSNATEDKYVSRPFALELFKILDSELDSTVDGHIASRCGARGSLEEKLRNCKLAGFNLNNEEIKVASVYGSPILYYEPSQILFFVGRMEMSNKFSDSKVDAVLFVHKEAQDSCKQIGMKLASKEAAISISKNLAQLQMPTFDYLKPKSSEGYLFDDARRIIKTDSTEALDLNGYKIGGNILTEAFSGVGAVIEYRFGSDEVVKSFKFLCTREVNN